MALREDSRNFLQRAALAQNSPELACLIAQKDWSQTPLGPPENWSPALRMMTEQVLSSGFGLLLWWGPEHIQIYNDAYRPVLGTKHPRALGQACAECFPEIWDVIGPMAEQPFHTGLASVTDDLIVDVNRYGFSEETHFAVAYSPVFDDTVPNGIGGVLATVFETTQQVVAARRIQLLRDLGSSTSGARDVREAALQAVRSLGTATDDIAFAAIYILNHERGTAELAATCGTSSLPTAKTVADLEQMFGVPFDDLASAVKADNTVAVPLAAGPDGKPAALLVACPSPRHAFDSAYLDFFTLIAAPISTAILNAQFYHAERDRREALEDLDRAKNAFFSNVSHEFRTPLTLMLGPLAELARSDDVATRSLAEKARRNSLRLLKLVNTLLEYSRLQAGRSDAAFAETDLATLTRHLIGVFGSAFESAGLELEVDIDRELRVFVDRSMWERIVLNLISNALKFTLQGAVRVSLHAVDGHAQLVVADTGVGIPPKELPHIFERFRRVRSAASRSHEGSGIGLALVKDLVELHAGTIEARSIEGAGTAFTVSVPLGHKHLERERIISDEDGTGYASSVDQYIADVTSTMGFEADLPAADTAVTSSTNRVLLADDNTDLLEYLFGMLSKRYHVTCVRDGVQALEELRRQRFDVVVSDVMMPRMDGFELLREIRADEDLRATPFIMLTARAGDSSAVEGLSAGADDYLTKPFNSDDLLARIYAQIHGASLRREAMHRLKASEDRFRTLASSLPGIVMETNAQGDVTFLSEGFSRYTGLPVEAGYRENWFASMHPDDAPGALQTWKEHVLAGEAYEREVRLRRHDGAFRWHHVSALPQRDAQGSTLRWTGTATDVHDRRLALEERELLAEASQAFSQSLDLATTLRTIAQFVVPRLADWCQIDVLAADGGIRTAAIAHRDPEKDRVAQDLIGLIHLNPDAERGTPRTIRTGQSELVPEVTVEMMRAAVPDETKLELYLALGITSGLSVPMTADGKNLGACSFVISSRDRKYTYDDLAIAQEIGRRAAVALQRAEAFEREHRVAESFQEASLPPSLPAVPGVRFDAVYVAGRSEAQVGGDWYDAVRLFDGRVVISIGDVAGSGLNAAVRMGNMRQIIRGIAQVHADPALMLDAADRALRLEHPEQMVTAFVGVVDPIAKTFTYASAGHPPALLRRPQGEVEALSDGGLPLGLRMYHRARQSCTIAIQDGSLLLLYTDGLTEMRRDALAGEKRLVELLKGMELSRTQRPAAYIQNAFLDGAQPHDDVAILAVRFDADPSFDSSQHAQRRWFFDVPDSDAAHVARREFSRALAEQGVSGDDLDAAELVFGELVGNVVRYATGPLEIALDCSGATPVLHVMDAGPGFQHIAILPTDPYSETGRGLYVVSALTQDFHVARRPQGGSHARAVLSVNHLLP